ncbi:hypothetical protein TNCV_3988521 [Trichonephila clavipes]|nr:hypothetical protein TNCV_3988521 [Trichonephila clavipes]
MRLNENYTLEGAADLCEQDLASVRCVSVLQRSPRTGSKKVSVGVGKRENLAHSVTNLGGRTGKFYDQVRSLLKSKNQEINRLQLAVKLPWAIFFESVDIPS